MDPKEKITLTTIELHRLLRVYAFIRLKDINAKHLKSIRLKGLAAETVLNSEISRLHAAKEFIQEVINMPRPITIENLLKTTEKE